MVFKSHNCFQFFLINQPAVYLYVQSVETCMSLEKIHRVIWHLPTFTQYHDFAILLSDTREKSQFNGSNSICSIYCINLKQKLNKNYCNHTLDNKKKTAEWLLLKYWQHLKEITEPEIIANFGTSSWKMSKGVLRTIKFHVLKRYNQAHQSWIYWAPSVSCLF